MAATGDCAAGRSQRESDYADAGVSQPTSEGGGCSDSDP